MKSISALEALEFLLVGITKNVHCGAHCPSSQFAIHNSMEPISSNLQCALIISTTRSTREGSNVRAPRSVRPPNNWIGATAALHHNLTAE
jgi:hypothetical protein